MNKLIVCAVLALLAPHAYVRAQSAPPPDITGLWGATLHFGPDIGGPLIIYVGADGRYHADLAGYTVFASVQPDVRIEGGLGFGFALPDGKGSFRKGYWIQQGVATPVRLVPDGPNRWRGTVVPLQYRLTYYMPITRQSDGTLRTYLRNPERNFGWFTRAKRLEVNGKDARLLGSMFGRGPDTTLAQGRYEDGVITLPLRGGTYEFTKVTDSSSDFYPRGNPPARYHYATPLQLGDGWPVGTLDEVGISHEQIERFVQMLIDMPMDSINTLQIHSLLIARHGKLVLEEYFHGAHRDIPHNTRSAAKSWTNVLIGAAMQSGVPLRIETPVYQTMLGTVPPDLDPRKKAMTLEHLLTMTAGFNCDPDDTTSANEDVMDERGVEHWWDYTLKTPLISAPGEKYYYCSTESHLAGGMLARLAGGSQLALFQRLLDQPMQLSNYYLGLRDDDLYGGGGSSFTSRDFLKLAQLFVNNGRWNGKQIVSADWVRRSTAPLRDFSPNQQYGFLWNSVAYDYNGRKIRAFFAGGNGGQVSMGIPDLDLVIVFTGGNYNDPVLFTGQRVLVPQWILPAVR